MRLDVYNVVSRDFGRFFEDVDVFVTPTCTRLAPPHAAFDPDQAFDAEGWIEHLFALEMFCVLFNVTGQPAISLPLHQAPDGSQIGVQLVAKFGDDEGLLRLARGLGGSAALARAAPAHPCRFDLVAVAWWPNRARPRFRAKANGVTIRACPV